MSQKAILIAGLVGLTFGFLFSGTLGVKFFDDEKSNNIVDNMPLNNDDNSDDEMMIDDTVVDPAIEQFRLDYNLSESIYVPINGDDVYTMIANNEDFIVFAGRKGCPYCQQFVPVLQAVAQSLGVDTIYYIDITMSENDIYLDAAGFAYPNSTFIYIEGVIQDNIIGFQNLNNTEAVLDDYFGN